MNSATMMLQTVRIAANNSEPNSRNNASLAALIGIETVLAIHRVVQHGFYAEALRAHLGSLATGLGLGTITRSSDIVRFVQGGVVKTFRWWTQIDSMATLLFRCAEPNPPVTLIARFRELTQLSIGDIRQRIADGVPLIEIEPFRNDWQESRHLLVQLSRAIDDGSLPLSVSESLDGDESPVPPDMLRNLIQRYRGIETETQMHTDLDLGEIDDPSEFQPHDDDWTT